VGRPREHDEHTAAALIEAAERIIEKDGIAALSIRAVASEVGTTTRAVYSLFGSKEGMIGALGIRAFDWLREGLAALPATDDPQADMVAAGLMFRRFATEHPSLFAIGIQRMVPRATRPQVFAAASLALDALKAKIERLAEADLLGGRTVDYATCEFHALCEGLAAVELRDFVFVKNVEAVWREALTALVKGFEAPVDGDLERAQ
jgi:AcrR family transcriptional regulator